MENTMWAAPGGPDDSPERTADVLMDVLGPEACRGLLDIWEAWDGPFVARPEYTALRERLDSYVADSCAAWRESVTEAEPMARDTALAMAVAVNGATIAARLSGIA